MRILVISDTHGDLRALTRIVEENQNADYILHLGDCEEECRALLADKPELASRFLRFRGNNDFGSSTPLFATLRVSLQHKIFFTHGHKYGVYYGTEQLVQTAKENHCDIALFGHTHCSMCAYTDLLRLRGYRGRRCHDQCHLFPAILPQTPLGIIRLLQYMQRQTEVSCRRHTE